MSLVSLSALTLLHRLPPQALSARVATVPPRTSPDVHPRSHFVDTSSVATHALSSRSCVQAASQTNTRERSCPATLSWSRRQKQLTPPTHQATSKMGMTSQRSRPMDRTVRRWKSPSPQKRRAGQDELSRMPACPWPRRPGPRRDLSPACPWPRRDRARPLTMTSRSRSSRPRASSGSAGSGAPNSPT